MIRAFIILISSLLINTILYSQVPEENPKPNIQILDSAAKTFVDSAINYVISKGIKTVHLVITPSDASAYLMQTFAEQSVGKDLKIIVSDSVTQYARMKILIKNFEINLINDNENDDYLIRTVKVNLSGSIVITDILESLPELDVKFVDKIRREDARRLGSTKFSFADPVIPEPPGSFLKDIIQPLTVVTAAVITVVLLFTIRSH